MEEGVDQLSNIYPSYIQSYPVVRFMKFNNRLDRLCCWLIADLKATLLKKPFLFKTTFSFIIKLLSNHQIIFEKIENGKLHFIDDETIIALNKFPIKWLFLHHYLS